jgi:hypothetical protein
MWKALNPGDSVSLGDLIRHITPMAITAFGEKAYEVVRTELHYFEIMMRSAKSEQETERKIIRYSDIGYHLGLEVWLDQITGGNAEYATGNG